MNNTIIVERQKMSLKMQAVSTVLAVAATVLLPLFCHWLGMCIGIGNGVGEVFLPMHLPVMLSGFLAGPTVGAITGIMGPVVSFAISGMPAVMALPFMIVELCTYGLMAGYLSQRKMPVIVKVILVQIIGRVARTLAVAIGIGIIGDSNLSIMSVWASAMTGIAGIILQLVTIPVIVNQNQQKQISN